MLIFPIIISQLAPFGACRRWSVWGAGRRWQKNEKKNNSVQRKWEFHCTKEVFACRPAAGSHIKAAVNCSNICIFLSSCICNHTGSCLKEWAQGSWKHLHSTLLQENTHSSAIYFHHRSLVTLLWEGGSVRLKAHAPSRRAKARGQSGKGKPLSPWQHGSQGGTFPAKRGGLIRLVIVHYIWKVTFKCVKCN